MKTFKISGDCYVNPTKWSNTLKQFFGNIVVEAKGYGFR